MRLIGRLRRGAQAIEFAAALPVYFALMSAIADYGWLYRQQMVLTMVARDGARAAALTPIGEDAEAVGVQQMAVSLSTLQIAPTGTSCQLSGFSPDQAVTCTVTVPTAALVGFIPLPVEQTAALMMRMEAQP